MKISQILQAFCFERSFIHPCVLTCAIRMHCLNTFKSTWPVWVCGLSTNTLGSHCLVTGRSVMYYPWCLLLLAACSGVYVDFTWITSSDAWSYQRRLCHLCVCVSVVCASTAPTSNWGLPYFRRHFFSSLTLIHLSAVIHFSDLPCYVVNAFCSQT